MRFFKGGCGAGVFGVGCDTLLATAEGGGLFILPLGMMVLGTPDGPTFEISAAEGGTNVALAAAIFVRSPGNFAELAASTAAATAS